MPEKGYFLRLTGAALLGFATLIIAVVVVLLLSPIILPLLAALFPFLVGSLLVIAAVIFVWIIVYACAIIGAVIYYVFKPMQVSEKPGTYTIKKAKEAGMREKGESEEEKKED